MNKILYIVITIFVLAGGIFYLLPKNPSPTPITNTNRIENSRYIPYAQTAFDAAKDKKRILFFHAPWCPTCRPADAEFSANANKIPEDVVLFKTDYDSSSELKKKYAITYQHTYVLVDNNGNELKKWNGGALSELITNTQ